MIQGFDQVAPFLTNPLVLIGFVVLLFFGLAKSLLKANIIPPLPKTTGGKVAMALLRYGFYLSLAVILLGFSLEAYKVYKKTSENDKVVSEVKDAITKFDVVDVSYEMKIPLSDPSLNNYLMRLKEETTQLVNDFKKKEIEFSASTAARGTELTKRLRVGMHTGFPDKNNILIPRSIYIHPGSPLLPNRENEVMAYSLFSNTSINFTFYVNPIAHSEYRNIFSAVNPDLAFGVTSNGIESTGNASFRYDIGSDFIVIEVSGVQAERRHFMAWSGKITSASNLPGSQVFIHMNALNEALGKDLEPIRERLKHSIDLIDLELYFEHGSPFSIPIDSMTKIKNDWNDDVRVYYFVDGESPLTRRMHSDSLKRR